MRLAECNAHLEIIRRHDCKESAEERHHRDRDEHLIFPVSNTGPQERKEHSASEDAKALDRREQVHLVEWRFGIGEVHSEHSRPLARKIRKFSYDGQHHTSTDRDVRRIVEHGHDAF